MSLPARQRSKPARGHESGGGDDGNIASVTELHPKKNRRTVGGIIAGVLGGGALVATGFLASRGGDTDAPSAEAIPGLNPDSEISVGVITPEDPVLLDESGEPVVVLPAEEGEIVELGFDWNSELGEANSAWAAYEVLDGQGATLETVPLSVVGNPAPFTATTPEGAIVQYLAASEASFNDWDADGDGFFQTDSGLAPVEYLSAVLTSDKLNSFSPDTRTDINMFGFDLRSFFAAPGYGEDGSIGLELTSLETNDSANDNFDLDYTATLVFTNWVDERVEYPVDGFIKGVYAEGVSSYAFGFTEDLPAAEDLY